MSSLHVAIARSSLGFVLVAGTDTAIRVLFLGDDEPSLRRDFAARFAWGAAATPPSPAFDALVARAVAALESPAKADELPLEPVGTEFQGAVWRALRGVPAGTTTSYGEIARRIGRPRAVRAVGQACGANPIAVIVPCHRVLRQGGGLSGYRWGEHRKAMLLARERGDATR